MNATDLQAWGALAITFSLLGTGVAVGAYLTASSFNLAMCLSSYLILIGFQALALALGLLARKTKTGKAAVAMSLCLICSLSIMLFK